MIRIYYKQLGGHFHCRVFSGPTGSAGKNGDLVFGNQEFALFRLACPGVEFREDDSW